MNVKKFAMKKDRAYELWKEYVQSCKDNPKDKFLQDMKKVYNQLKSGRKVIDIIEVFKKSRVKYHNYTPKLGIVNANATICYVNYSEDGTVTFTDRQFNRWNWYPKKTDVIINNIFPQIPANKQDKNFRDMKEGRIRLQAPVPKIPASIRPKGDLKNYYVLWEVEKWQKVIPKDPYLLRRITNNMFVVVAGWNLTALERAVMKGRVY